MLSICLGGALLLVSLYAIFVMSRMIRYRRRLMYGNSNPEILATEDNYSKHDECPHCKYQKYLSKHNRILCRQCNSEVETVRRWRVAYNGHRRPLYPEVIGWIRQQEKQ